MRIRGSLFEKIQCKVRGTILYCPHSEDLQQEEEGLDQDAQIKLLAPFAVTKALEDRSDECPFPSS